MKVGVIGSRGFDDYDLLAKMLSRIDITLLVSGGADGADYLGELYADKNKIPKKIFHPDWKQFGKQAGFIRNTDIINESEMIIAFWDKKSKGTKDSIDKVNEYNKKNNIKKKLLIIEI